MLIELWQRMERGWQAVAVSGVILCFVLFGIPIPW